MKDFRDLQVWQKAHRLVIAIYESTAGFPVEERYGLTSQLRRGATSVAANIAEGCGRGSNPDFARFLQHSMGSASELEYHLLLALDLHVLDQDTHTRLSNDTTEVKRMLAALIQRVRAEC